MTTPMDVIIPERAPSLGVALRFFLLGLAFLAAMLLLAVWQARPLTSDYLHNPVTLGVTHLFVLGFAASVVTGAIYQMVPVLLHSKLRSETGANVHLALHGAGVLLMVLGFLQFHILAIIIGGSLVLAGVGLFLWNLGATLKAAERWNWHGIFIAVAVLYYVSTLSWGLTMAFNLQYFFLGEVRGAPLATHLALGLLGWYSLMIVGVGLKLVPMFAPAKALPAPVVAAIGTGLAGGTAAIVAGLWLSRPLLWAGLAATGVALLVFAGAMAYTFLHRRQGPLDFSVRFSLTAGAALAMTVLLFPWAGGDLLAGLVFLFSLGWIGGTMLGMLLRIIPFMVWLHRFRHRLQKKERIPFLHETYQPRWAWVAYLAWFPGALALAGGVALHSPAGIAAGALVCLAGLAGFGQAVRQVLHHVPPGTRPLFPGKR